MKNYLQLIAEVVSYGENRKDRTGVGTRAIFGTFAEWDLRQGFPAITTKKLAWKAIVSEALWFLSGSSNVEELREILHGPDSDKTTIWDANYNNQGKALGYTDGDLGPVYGKQWRDFSGVDQIRELIEKIKQGHKTGEYSRRMLVTAWNPKELPDMALPPCHHTFQVYVNNKRELSLMWHQRSVDVFLGLPFNIASYALIAHILAQLTGCTVNKLVFTGGDTHIYRNHMDQIAELLEREPLDLPTLEMPEFQTLEELLNCPVESFKLLNYHNHGVIAAPMAV